MNIPLVVAGVSNDDKVLSLARYTCSRTAITPFCFDLLTSAFSCVTLMCHRLHLFELYLQLAFNNCISIRSPAIQIHEQIIFQIKRRIQNSIYKCRHHIASFAIIFILKQKKLLRHHVAMFITISAFWIG